MKSKWGVLILTMFIMIAVAALSGCERSDGAGTGKKAGEPAVNNEPVTLKLYNWGFLTDDAFQHSFAEPVKKKYPYITMTMTTRGNTDTPESLAVSGNEVDMIISWNAVAQFQSLRLLTDLTPLTKKYNIDLQRFDSGSLQRIRQAAEDQGKLYGLPYGSDFNALYYNKDLFNKFGVSYPADGMSWDAAIEVAKKLTRQEGNVQYKGLDPEGVVPVGQQLSLTFVDLATNKFVADTNGWRRVFELAKRINDIPGNAFSIVTHAKTLDRFTKDRNEAMLATNNILSSLAGASEFNWDIAQYPSFPEHPNVYQLSKLGTLSLTSNGKHPEQAMLVMQALLSDDVQSDMMKQGTLISLLNNAEIQKNFGAELPALKGKRIEAIFKSKSAPMLAAESDRFPDIKKIIEREYGDYASGKKDVNTALRETAEETNQLLSAN